MGPSSKTDTVITRLARKVGHVAGKIAVTTQGLAASAAAIVHSESSGNRAAEVSPPFQAHDSRTPRSARRASKKKLSKSSSNIKPTNKAGSTNKKTNKKKNAKKSNATKSRKRHSRAVPQKLP